MNITIVGGGKVGTEIIAALVPEGHNISVIDRRSEVVEQLTNEYDILGVVGSGVIVKTLEAANVRESDLLIATTDMDEINILSCVIARRLGVKGTIARVRDPEINSQVLFMREGIGVSMMVNPEYTTAREISRMLRIPNAAHVESFAKGRIDMVELMVPEGSNLAGIALKDLHTRFGTRILICAVQREETDEVFIPGGDFIIREGDRVHLTASHDQISSFFRQTGSSIAKIKNVMIIGGGRNAFYLSQMLVDSGMKVKIIERDHDRCNFLARRLPKVQTICADAAKQEILLEEGIGDVDACIVLTDMDEDNIIMSMFARMQKCPKVITKVNSPALRKMAIASGVESCVSPKELTSAIILSYVRALKQTTGGILKSMYKLVDGKVEAMEFIASEEGRVMGVPLSKLPLKKNILIAGIFRGGKIIFPTGTDSIQPGDVVIVVTLNHTLSSLDQILE